MPKMSKWYVDKGEQGDIVLSTRVRLARNLEEYPFPCRLDTAGKIKVNEKVRDTLLSCVPELGLHYVTMDSLSREQAISLAERHLISPEFASVREGRALMLTEDETVGIMLCEEDHIRVQVMKSGLALMDCYVLADKIDSALDKKLNFAFDERLGYLTQCPTNLGTAHASLRHAASACAQKKRSALGAQLDNFKIRALSARRIRRGQGVARRYLSAQQPDNPRHNRAGGD